MDIEIPFTRKGCFGEYSLDLSKVQIVNETALEVALEISTSLNRVVMARGPVGWHMMIIYIAILTLFVSVASCLALGVSTTVVVVLVPLFLAFVWLPLIIWTTWRIWRFSQALVHCLNELNDQHADDGVLVSIRLNMMCLSGAQLSWMMYNNLRFAHVNIHFAS